jgi:hypothetical protein
MCISRCRACYARQQELLLLAHKFESDRSVHARQTLHQDVHIQLANAFTVPRGKQGCVRRDCFESKPVPGAQALAQQQPARLTSYALTKSAHGTIARCGLLV